MFSRELGHHAPNPLLIGPAQLLLCCYRGARISNIPGPSGDHLESTIIGALTTTSARLSNAKTQNRFNFFFFLFSVVSFCKIHQRSNCECDTPRWPQKVSHQSSKDWLLSDNVGRSSLGLYRGLPVDASLNWNVSRCFAPKCTRSC